MKTPLNKKTLSQHMHYSWWMYALALVLCIFLWDIIYTVTAPRTPENEKLELYIYAYGDSKNVDAYLAKVQEEELDDVKELTAQYVMPDETSGVVVLATRLMAGEGDLFLLPRDVFSSYAGQGLFVALDEWEGVEDACSAAGINIERGWRKNQDTGERHLYAIPTTLLNMIPSWTYSSGSEMYLCVRLYNGNDDNAEKLFHIILRDSLPEPASADTEETEAAETAGSIDSETETEAEETPSVSAPETVLEPSDAA